MSWPWCDAITSQVVGARALGARLAPLSAAGRALALEPLQDRALRHELDALASLTAWARDRPLEPLMSALRELPELRALRRRLDAAEVLRDEDLFTLKRFLFYAEALLAQASEPLAWLCEPDLMAARCQALRLGIHPEAAASPRFMLVDAHSAALAQARDEHRQRQRQLRQLEREHEALTLARYPRARFDLEGVMRLPAGEHEARELARADAALIARGDGWIVASPALTQARDQELAALEALREQEAQVRASLTAALVLPARGWLQALGEALAHLDVRLAKERLRRELDGCWPCPLAVGQPMTLTQARQPQTAQAQPLDMTLSPCRGVVVTGPNMGGKSSLLKLIGLMQWCLHHAMPAPASSFAAPLVGGLCYVGADEVEPQRQSLGLSAFGREVRRLVTLSQRVSAGALWLLDEVGRGTHPEEGDALAQAVLRGLLQRGHHVIAATHFPGMALMPEVERWRIAGLRPEARLEARLEAELGAPRHEALGDDLGDEDAAHEALTRALREAMDYQPLRAEPDAQVPRDAWRVARALGLWV